MLLALAFYPVVLVATPIVGSIELAVDPPELGQGSPAPRWRGIGLSIAAGMAGTVGLAANIGRIGVVQSACAATGVSDAEELVEAVKDCIYDSRVYISLSVLAPFANMAALGLAAGAGGVNGRHRAWQTVHGDGRRAAAGASIGVGAGLLGASVLAYVVARVGLWRDVYGVRGCIMEDALRGECVRSRWSGWLGAITVGQAGASVGAGLLTFGLTYRTHRGYQRRGATLSVEPVLALSHVGLRLTGRF